MSLITVTFWNDNFDSYRIPSTVHCYLISVFVNEIFSNGDKVVKIIPLTLDSPKPRHERPFIVKSSTKDKAITEAVNILKDLPALRDLNYSQSSLSKEEKNPKILSSY